MKFLVEEFFEMNFDFDEDEEESVYGAEGERPNKVEKILEEEKEDEVDYDFEF